MNVHDHQNNGSGQRGLASWKDRLAERFETGPGATGKRLWDQMIGWTDQSRWRIVVVGLVAMGLIIAWLLFTMLLIAPASERGGNDAGAVGADAHQLVLDGSAAVVALGVGL